MAKKQSGKPRRDIYQEVTDRILALLEQGTVPWRNPIRRSGRDGWPKSLSSMKRYRGINVFLLAVRAWESGFGSDYWLTYRQAQELGGNVRKGEEASLVTFWKLYEKTDKETGNELTLPVLRHYNVFNAEQCDGITPPDAVKPAEDGPPFEPIERAEAIIAGYPDPPLIEQRGQGACYRYQSDTVQIPPPELFKSKESYYATLFHECSHATGHKKRLDRGFEENPAPFGSADYSREELVAEMSAAFLCAAAGISPPTIEQSAAYIANWSKKLQGDKKLVVVAASAAQKSADWIFGEVADGENRRDDAVPFSPE